MLQKASGTLLLGGVPFLPRMLFLPYETPPPVHMADAAGALMAAGMLHRMKMRE